MKFMFFSEAETLPGASYQTRYWELIEQVIHAEKWGFDSFGVSETEDRRREKASCSGLPSRVIRLFRP